MWWSYPKEKQAIHLCKCKAQSSHDYSWVQKSQWHTKVQVLLWSFSQQGRVPPSLFPCQFPWPSMNLISFRGQRKLSVVRNLYRESGQSHISKISQDFEQYHRSLMRMSIRKKNEKQQRKQTWNPLTTLFSFANSEPVTSLWGIRLNHFTVLRELKSKRWNKVQGSPGSLQLSDTWNVSQTRENEGQVEVKGVTAKGETYRTA